MKELLRTTDITVVIFAKALLDGQCINCFEMDVNMSIMEAGTGLFPRRLMVCDRDLLCAQRVMRDNQIEYGMKY
ncbi:MAG TPA: hypothetical protein DD729_05930 [Rhodobacteraceae bacterium]|jgi:hypothetical protein|nr:hypothetical protein [Paracoccaceae bacterium]